MGGEDDGWLRRYNARLDEVIREASRGRQMIMGHMSEEESLDDNRQDEFWDDAPTFIIEVFERYRDLRRQMINMHGVDGKAEYGIKQLKRDAGDLLEKRRRLQTRMRYMPIQDYSSPEFRRSDEQLRDIDVNLRVVSEKHTKIQEGLRI